MGMDWNVYLLLGASEDKLRKTMPEEQWDDLYDRICEEEVDGLVHVDGAENRDEGSWIGVILMDRYMRTDGPLHLAISDLQKKIESATMRFREVFPEFIPAVHLLGDYF